MCRGRSGEGEEKEMKRGVEGEEKGMRWGGGGEGKGKEGEVNKIGK